MGGRGYASNRRPPIVFCRPPCGDDKGVVRTTRNGGGKRTRGMRRILYSWRGRGGSGQSPSDIPVLSSFVRRVQSHAFRAAADRRCRRDRSNPRPSKLARATERLPTVTSPLAPPCCRRLCLRLHRLAPPTAAAWKFWINTTIDPPGSNGGIWYPGRPIG